MELQHGPWKEDILGSFHIGGAGHRAKEQSGPRGGPQEWGHLVKHLNPVSLRVLSTTGPPDG